jgi:hypothetical protein
MKEYTIWTMGGMFSPKKESKEFASPLEARTHAERLSKETERTVRVEDADGNFEEYAEGQLIASSKPNGLV